MPTLFTVVITTKNRPEYLREAVDSVLRQDSNYLAKLVIVDDGSDIPVSDQLHDLQSNDWEVLRNDQSVGVSAARNQGARAAKSAWVIFLDDDDWLEDNFISAITATAEGENPPDFIWSSRTMVFEDKNVEIPKQAPSCSSLEAGNSDAVLAGLLDATSSGMAFRRESLIEVGGFDERLTVSEDRDLIFKLLSEGYRASPAQAAILFFRIHGGPRLSLDEKAERQAQADLTVICRHRPFLFEHPVLANRFLGRVAKRLWDNRFYREAINVTSLQCRISPFSMRARKRQIGWYLMAMFRSRT
jgi:glycosyltransferase involved in cell wall biosynthesis